MLDPAMMLDKVTKILELMKVPADVIGKVKESVTNGKPADVAVVKVETEEKPEEEVKLTAQQIDKMSEKEAKDALKKEMGCDMEESKPYTGTDTEKAIRGSMMSGGM